MSADGPDNRPAARRRDWELPARVANVERSTLRRPNVFDARVVSLASGDPAILIPQRVLDSLSSAVGTGVFRYAHPDGVPALRDAIARRLTEVARRPVSAADVLVTNGATSGIGAAALALLSPGDRVLLPSPIYSLYADAVRLADAVPEFVASAAPEFRLPLDGLARAAPGAAAVFICNPCNPTGAVYPAADLRALAAIAARHGLIVAVDEAYASIVYPPARFVPAASIGEMADRLVLLDTFSKRLCITGLRLGFVSAPAKLLSAIKRVHRTTVGPVNTPVQTAVAEVLADEEPFRAALLDEFSARRTDVIDALGGLPGVRLRPPDGAFYAFLGLDGAEDSELTARSLLRHGVAVRPGAEFGPGGEGFVRLAFCGDRAELREGLRRVATAVPALRRAPG